MIGTLFRFLILRVLGGRAVAALAVVGAILGWRSRRRERLEAEAAAPMTPRTAYTPRSRVRTSSTRPDEPSV